MAGASAEPGSNGNKLDTELNLVPFIDLLSTLTLFLLLTVVWVQLAAIPTGVDSKGKSSTAPTEQNKLLVHLSGGGSYEITWPTALQNAGFSRSARNADELLRLASSAAKKVKAIPPASVSAGDSVDYGVVIQAVDTLKSAGFKIVALSTE